MLRSELFGFAAVLSGCAELAGTFSGVTSLCCCLILLQKADAMAAEDYGSSMCSAVQCALQERGSDEGKIFCTTDEG